MKPEYDPLPITCDLSLTSLQEAALQVGPAFEYDLIVSPYEGRKAANLAYHAQLRDNPFAPYINVLISEDFAPNEWCLRANGRGCGSSFD